MTTGIVIAQRLGTTKTLQQRVRRENHVLDFLNAAILPTGYCSDVLHNPLRCFGLASTRFTGYDDTLILVIRIHIVVCRLCYAEDMRRNF